MSHRRQLIPTAWKLITLMASQEKEQLLARTRRTYIISISQTGHSGMELTHCKAINASTEWTCYLRPSLQNWLIINFHLQLWMSGFKMSAHHSVNKNCLQVKSAPKCCLYYWYITDHLWIITLFIIQDELYFIYKAFYRLFYVGFLSPFIHYLLNKKWYNVYWIFYNWGAVPFCESL